MTRFIALGVLLSLGCDTAQSSTSVHAPEVSEPGGSRESLERGDAEEVVPVSPPDLLGVEIGYRCDRAQGQTRLPR